MISNQWHCLRRRRLHELLGSGYPAAALIEAKHSRVQLAGAAITTALLRTVGFSLEQLYAVGDSAHELRQDDTLSIREASEARRQVAT